jgi:CHAT domain-containing protein
MALRIPFPQLVILLLSLVGVTPLVASPSRAVLVTPDSSAGLVKRRPDGLRANSMLTQATPTADQLLEQGIQLYRGGQAQQALPILIQALSQYRAQGDAKQVVRSLRNLGNAYYTLANAEQAMAAYQESLTLAQQIEDRAGETAALGNIGAIYAFRGEFKQANLYYQKALVGYRVLQDRLGEGQTLGNLAEGYAANQQYPQAIAAYQQAIAIAQEVKDAYLEVNSRGALSVVAFTLGNYAQAIDDAQQALVLARRHGYRPGESAALNYLGNSYYAQGDYGQALTYQEQRLTLARQTGDRLGETEALTTLAKIASDLGDYTQALQYAFQSLELAQAIQNPNAIGGALTELGNLYFVAQDWPKALDYHGKRLRLAESSGNRPGMAVAQANLGNVYKAMGQYAKAIAAHQQALSLARQIQDRLGESAALVNLGVEHDELGQSAEAIAFYRQALQLSQSLGDRATEGLILNNLGNTLYKTGQLTEAEQVLQAGLQAWEGIRASLGTRDRHKVSLFDQQARTYRLLQRVLVAQNKPELALEITERGRARAFAELLSRRLQPGSSTPDPSVAILPSPSLSEMRAIAQAHQATLVEYALTYEDEQIDQQVRPREAELYIWVIDPRGQISFRQVNLRALGGTTPLADLVIASRERLGVGDRGLGVVASPAPSSQPLDTTRLYDLLIAPIADLLPQQASDRVVIIPQQSLFLVPFAALQSGTSAPTLIEQHTLLTAPSIQVLELTRQQQQRQMATGKTRGTRVVGHPSQPVATTPALVVGNPLMPQVRLEANQPPTQLASLPGAELEAKAIADLLGTQAMTGARATKPVVIEQMARARLIHLATHGLLDDFKGQGVPGAIALAPSGVDSGLLTADEILDLRLQAELVVLSACDTGRGRISGDGVIGLSRSFISAGVPSLVVSLWSVPDAPTAQLMTEFYRQLQQQPDKAQALRQAMLKTKAAYPNPKDWAAFTLIGNAQ